MRRFHRVVISIVACLAAGCNKIGPDKLETDRSDYGYAIGQTWKEQGLLNIVKIRYHEWPLFLSVEQIVTQYTQEHTGTISADIRKPWQGKFNVYEPGYVGKYNERPTVRLIPLRGIDYALTMLTPMNPATMFALVEAGWPAEQILRTGVGSVNGFHNDHFEFGVHYRADPEFVRFVKLLSKLQSEGAVTVDIVLASHKEADSSVVAEATTTAGAAPVTVRLNIEDQFLDEEIRQELRQLKYDLGLDPDRDHFRIIFGNDAEDAQTMVVETRSILQVMSSLASHVEVPTKDIQEGRISSLQPVPEMDDSGFKPLMRIRSGTEAPTDAFISIPYRDQWFWIDGQDHDSKRTFTFLSVMMNVIETDSSGSSGQIVIPVTEEEATRQQRDREEDADDGGDE